jgi:hypothetical protein
MAGNLEGELFRSRMMSSGTKAFHLSSLPHMLVMFNVPEHKKLEQF